MADVKVLVCYASRHGATAGIAERIAATLETSGFDVDCREVGEERDVGRYDAYVVGSAAYMYHWLKDATKFVRRNRKVLANRPVWLFSSGPIGTDLVDDKGQDIFEAMRPKELDELQDMVHPIGTRVFFGAWDPNAAPVGMAERAMKLMPASAREAIPAGDFRDWTAIEDWAAEIASALN